MNAVPGFELSEEKPKLPWVTMIVVGLLTMGMALGLAVHFLGSIEWPAHWRLGGAPAVEDYTLFKVVTIGQGEVHTGYVFARSGDAVPSHQYCYAQIKRDGLRAANHMRLADKEPGKPVRYHAVTAEEAVALGLSHEEARQLASKHCRFRDEGGW
jgi:hypothetical protein